MWIINKKSMEENVQNTAPVIKLPTNRALWKYIVFTPITLGIYPIVVYSKISTEINKIASKHDGKSTMHYCLIFFIFSWLTLGIVPVIWWNNISGRIGRELALRNLPYSFSEGTFWGWSFFGSLIIVGPFIYIHKLFKAMNMLCEDYNQKG